MTTVARLRALVTVADAGSVREAARRLTVTESAVSAALSALAREVRVPLVERDGRGLRLTASGQAYSMYARAILGLHEEGLAAARGDRDPERGRVRVAAVSTAGEYLLPAALAAFLSRHPAVDLRLEVGSSERLWGLFAAHETVRHQPHDVAAARGRIGDQGHRRGAAVRPRRGSAPAHAGLRRRHPRLRRGGPRRHPGVQGCRVTAAAGRGTRGGRGPRHAAAPPVARRDPRPPAGRHGAARAAPARPRGMARAENRGRHRDPFGIIKSLVMCIAKHLIDI